MVTALKAWFEGRPDLDLDHFVLIDEIAPNTAMTHRYVSAPRGEHCRMGVPQHHWRMTTVQAGLRARGIGALWLLDRTMNGQAFRTFVADVLARALEGGDTVVLDNLPAHKVIGPLERIEAVTARLFYLPAADSPDLNLVGLAFTNLKALLRSAAA